MLSSFGGVSFAHRLCCGWMGGEIAQKNKNDNMNVP